VALYSTARSSIDFYASDPVLLSALWHLSPSTGIVFPYFSGTEIVKHPVS
jgi:hypothetical protein